MNKKISIVLVGVGGQGVITAANILGNAAVKADVMVYVSEIHGMAQRGGNVVCTVRMGEVSSPMLPSGTADVVLSAEPIEALRNISFVNKKTKVITDINPVIPFTVAVGGEPYPKLDDVFKEISKHAELYKIDALKIAKESGDAITKNTVLLGALAATGVLPFKPDVLLETILNMVPDKYKDVNRKAFENGMKAIKK
ncbi:MAG: indolepyruvate ferredoxin oxidoreductase subunit beta [Candidatus Thermoplasmatota archaeon]|jgi:indolepyruvate ferredoxin oxidoreductase beta subunit|nr:indolepyruvate ferredoxin oxidoreductase subunit beta [Candidatus Thermoplasmatota archaeon]